MLKPDHSLAWNNMVILLDNTGKVQIAKIVEVIGFLFKVALITNSGTKVPLCSIASHV